MNTCVFTGFVQLQPILQISVNGNEFSILRLKIPKTTENLYQTKSYDVIEVLVWKTLARQFVSNAKKDSLICVKCRVQSRTYETKENLERLAYDFIAEKILILK